MAPANEKPNTTEITNQVTNTVVITLPQLNESSLMKSELFVSCTSFWGVRVHLFCEILVTLAL